MRDTTVVALGLPGLLAVALLTGGGTQGARERRPPASTPRTAIDTGRQGRVDPRARIFIARGCQECHAIAALGVTARTDVGPDLTFANADVPNRYGVSLRSFFSTPTPPGLMGFVLAAHVNLSQADRDSIVHVLEMVYRERLADMDKDIPSFPPTRARVATRPGVPPASPRD